MLRKRDLAAIGGLLAIDLIWGALLIAQPDRFCISDCHLEVLPRLIAIARDLQAGALPVWDPGTMAGAKPFWMSSGGIYYPLLLPLYWLTDPEDLSGSVILLQIVPYVLHVFLAALGGFFFARRMMKLTAPAAAVTGVLYSFAPAMLSTISFVNYAQGFSYLPWMTWLALRVFTTGSCRLWALGAAAIGLMCSSTNPDQANRNLVVLGLQTLGYVLIFHRSAFVSRSGILRLLSILAMALVGMATYGFGFAGVFQGISMVVSSVGMTCERAADFVEYSSLPPTSLFTIFYPPAFAETAELANLGTGAVALGAVTAAVLAFFDPRRRGWAMLAAGIAVFALLIVLGKHTPFFGIACRAMPLAFRFPHPVYYTFCLSWGLALLAGLGVDALIRGQASRRVVVLCSWPLLALVLVNLLRPEIRSFGWMLGPFPASVYALVVAALWLAILRLPPHWRGRVLALAVICEASASAVEQGLYLPSNPQVDWFDHTRWTNAHSPLTGLAPVLRRLTQADDVRFVGTRSSVDNQAWRIDSRSLFGMAAKPAFPQFEREFLRFTANAPYQLWLTGLPPMLSNMNVGLLVADREPRYHEMLSRDYAEFDRAVGSLPLIEQTAHFDIRRLPEPLPYVYTQDRIEVAGEDEQFERLYGSDLREAAYVGGDCARAAPPGLVLPAAAPAGGFAELQQQNRIVRVNRSNPNRKEILVDAGRAALLVVAEHWHAGWRAEVDGAPARVWPVNFLQQGVWLPAGRHVVELTFRPVELIAGAGISAVAIVIVAVVGLSGRRRDRGARDPG